jgi:hypothetical protein
MKRPESINYTSNEWAAITRALTEMTEELDVMNRDMNLDHETTQKNRAMQAAYATIIGWGKPNKIVAQETPPYALHSLGDNYDPTKPHPDDDPIA